MEEKSMYTGYRWLILLVTCLGILSCYIDMIVYAPILGEVAKSLNVDMGAAANLMMGFVLAVAVVLMWGGVICDKYGITVAIVLSLLCASIPATFVSWFSGSYATLFIGRLIQGASVGFIFAVIGPVLVLWFPPKEQGLASGLMIGSLSIGAAIGVVASPPIFEAVGSWQTMVALLSIPGWVTIVLSLLITRKPPSPQILKNLEAAMSSAQGGVSLGGAIFTAITFIGSFILFFEGWGLYVLLNLVPPYLAAPAPMGVGFGPVTAGKISLAVTIVGVFAMILGGVFFDKVAKGKAQPAVLIGFVMVGIFSYLILLPVVYNSLFLLVVILIIAGWGCPFMCPSLSAYIAMNYPMKIVGRMVGVWFGFGTFGGAAGLYFGGMTIAKTGNFYWAITMISFAAILGFILALFLKPKVVHN